MCQRLFILISYSHSIIKKKIYINSILAVIYLTKLQNLINRPVMNCKLNTASRHNYYFMFVIQITPIVGRVRASASFY
jgi:hypothetical protein